MEKSILITNEEIKKLVKESLSKKIIIPKESVNNIFSLYENKKENILMEGIFKTYPPEKVLKYLKKRYGDAAIINIFDGDNDEKVFVIKTGDIDYNQDIIDKDMFLCGYFPSFVEKNNGERTIQYEPRYENVINNIVEDEEFIYHLTPTNKVKKILQIGLTPKTNNKKFVYPDRIYFFLYEPCKEDCLFLMQQFYEETFKSYKMGISKEVTYNGSYTLLAIDTEKITEKCNFFYDPNAENCVYTYDNVPPEAIEIVQEIEQKYLNNKNKIFKNKIYGKTTIKKERS